MSYDVVEPGAVLLLHGVGLDPCLFEQMQAVLPAPTTAPLRPTYEIGDTADRRRFGVGAQAAELAQALAGCHGVTVVGVSGGATVALALALLDAPGVAGIVAHEPLVGPLGVDLHAAVNASAAELDVEPGTDGVLAFLARLVGVETWSALPPTAASFAVTHADVVRAEVRAFAAFAPDPVRLAAIRTPLVVTTGAESHHRRHAAAAALAAVAPIRTACVDGAGHLAHVEQPAALGALIERHRRAWSET